MEHEMTRSSLSVCERLLRAIGHTGLPGRHRLVRYLAPPRDGTQRPFTVRAHGLTYSGDLSEFIDWNICYFGSYAMAELRFLAACAQLLARRERHVNFFDIGANVGEHSLF